MNLSEHFTYAEFIRSSKARVMSIDNTPGADLLPAMRFTCQGLERIRALVGAPLWILSGFRCEALNLLVRGSKSSQHIRGEAADIICPGFGRPKKLAQLILKHELDIEFDQLIAERNDMGHEWVHVSFTPMPRYQAMTMTKNGLVIGVS